MIDHTWYTRPQGVPTRLTAGGVVLRREAGQLLVALVAEAGYAQYILPKGKVEPGERLEQAARREVLEEAGLSRLYLLAKLGVCERLNFPKKAWSVTHFFLFLTTQTIGQPVDRKHEYRCAWFPLDALPEMFWPEQHALLVRNAPRIRQLGETFSSP